MNHEEPTIDIDTVKEGIGHQTKAERIYFIGSSVGLGLGVVVATVTDLLMRDINEYFSFLVTLKFVDLLITLSLFAVLLIGSIRSYKGLRMLNETVADDRFQKAVSVCLTTLNILIISAVGSTIILHISALQASFGMIGILLSISWYVALVVHLFYKLNFLDRLGLLISSDEIVRQVGQVKKIIIGVILILLCVDLAQPFGHMHNVPFYSAILSIIWSVVIIIALYRLYKLFELVKDILNARTDGVGSLTEVQKNDSGE